MKKTLKYLSFLPFAISIGSLVIYLFYTIRIRFSRRVIITPELTNTLKIYLIISLIFLFIGLLVILIKKIYSLKTNDIVSTNQKVRNEYTTNNDVIKVNLINSNIQNGKITGKIADTNQNVEIYMNDKKDYSFKLDGVSCPECGGIISKDAAICPHCGIMFDEEVLSVLDKIIVSKPYKKKVKKGIVIANILLILVFIFLIFLVSNLLINKADENKNNINPIVMSEENM